MRKTQGTNEYANVRCGIQDRDGNLWFGTAGEGVYRYNGKLFTQYLAKDGLSGNTVWSLLQDGNGIIWLGTNQGLCRFDGKSFISVSISGAGGSTFFPTTSPDPPAVKFDVWSICQDTHGNLWFGTSIGIYTYNGRSFSNFLRNPAVLNKDGVRLTTVGHMLEDKKGNMWFGSGIPAGEEGACRFDGKTVVSMKPAGDKWIRTILHGSDGDLYFATRHNGVLRYDGNTFTNVTAKAGINNSSVTTILEDKKGNLWIATELGSGQIGEDGGVWRFDGKTFTRFTTKDGLVHNGVWCIVEDKDGNLWFGTRNNGLNRFDGQRFTSFSE